MMIKLKDLVMENSRRSDGVSTNPSPIVPVDGKPVPMGSDQKRKLSKMVSQFNEYGKAIYRDRDIVEVANHLHEIAALAEGYALNASGDFIEESTVKRNMLELKKYNESFSKLAKEAKVRQHQMEALYEDMGNVLERYFEIK